MVSLKNFVSLMQEGSNFPFAGNSAVSEPGREAVLDQADVQLLLLS